MKKVYNKIILDQLFIIINLLLFFIAITSSI